MRSRGGPSAPGLPGPPGLAAPTVRGGWRGETGPVDVFVLSSDDRRLLATLRESGLRGFPLDGPEQLGDLEPDRSVLLVTDPDERPGRLLADVNAAALANGVPWLPISAYDGAVLHVGPLILPGDTACFECTRRRLAATPAYASLYDSIIVGAPAAPAPEAVRSWAYALATLVLLHWLGRRDPELPGELLTLVPADLLVLRSRVFRVPRCPACGVSSP